METRLKALLHERHWTYSTFCREYDRAAGSTAPELLGTAPSRAQLHRWISGQLKGLPFPDHCHVLEKMFPGWTVRQLFEPVDSADPGEGPMIDRLVREMSAAFALTAPGRAGWGAFAARPGHKLKDMSTRADNGIAVVVAKKLVAQSRLLRLGQEETAQLAGLAGNVVELGQTIDIDIGVGGAATVSYRHEVFNMTDIPVTRFTRQLWFQRTSGTLNIEPASDAARRVSIHRVHDAGNIATFACRIAPAVAPGEIFTVAYTCVGGIIDGDLFWRQTVAHYTRHLTLTVRGHGLGEFVNCGAVEEHPDGVEHPAVDDLLVDHESDTATLTFTRDYLRPGQALTLRWEWA